MTALDDLALVVQLACLTEDRSKAEQKALLAIAQDVDRKWNRQASSNPKVRREWLRLGCPTVLRIPATGPKSGDVPCTYSTDHPKTCPCRGDGYAVEPEGGWSRLVALVEETWGRAFDLETSA
jgi:hypothetical protein